MKVTPGVGFLVRFGCGAHKETGQPAALTPGTVLEGAGREEPDRSVETSAVVTGWQEEQAEPG